MYIKLQKMINTGRTNCEEWSKHSSEQDGRNTSEIEEPEKTTWRRSHPENPSFLLIQPELLQGTGQSESSPVKNSSGEAV